MQKHSTVLSECAKKTEIYLYTTYWIYSYILCCCFVNPWSSLPAITVIGEYSWISTLLLGSS
uniref:Uncharacterized protein n=1 Tax=Anguilla anguilla TaxID=7936 RepID=A0A0E9R346_ANGAN